MKTKMKKQNLFKIICHITFILGLLWCFQSFSFLRPAPYGAIYKECIVALVLLLMLYINYLVFIPKLFLKRKYDLFLILSLTSVFAATAVEMIYLIPDIKDCYPASFTEQEKCNAIIMHSFFVCGRNMAFLLFFFILRILENEKRTLERERNALMELKGEICIPNGKDGMKIINISDIFYLSHERNYTYIYTMDGCRYCQYISLSKRENLLPKDLFCRINRNVIVPIIRIVKVAETSVTIFGGDPACEHSFNVSEKYALDVKNKINEGGGLKSKNGGLNHIQAPKTMDSRDIFDEFGGLKTIDLEEFNRIIAKDKVLLTLCQILARKESVNMKTYMEEMNVPLRTIERKMKYLKENHIIRHEGARKNGNYAFTPYVSEEVKAWLINKEDCQLLNE
jgi:hypothetical protein